MTLPCICQCDFDDRAYWVDKSIFRICFDQHDFENMREVLNVALRYRQDWFEDVEQSPLLFFPPTVFLIAGKTQFISGRHRTAVLLACGMEKIPIAFDFTKPANRDFIYRLQLEEIGRSDIILLPNLPIVC